MVTPPKNNGTVTGGPMDPAVQELLPFPLFFRIDVILARDFSLSNPIVFHCLFNILYVEKTRGKKIEKFDLFH